MAPSLNPASPSSESAFDSLVLSTRGRAALSELHRRFSEARSSLLRIRADRTRLARTGWKPAPPVETKMIRAAEWMVEKRPGSVERPACAIEHDLEYAFVPTVRAFAALGNELTGNQDGDVRVRLRSLDREESRYTIEGRPVAAAFFDLVFVLERRPDALVSLPRIESYLEARFWAELCRALESALEFPKHSIRLEAGVETSIGTAEVEEVVFELKETIESIAYDPRIDLADQFRLDSGFPSVPKRDYWAAPWSAPETKARFDALVGVAKRRGLRAQAPELQNREEVAAPISLEVLREKTAFAFTYLRGWFEGSARFGDRDWADFELARAMVWTAIRSGFLREEVYDGWKDAFGPQPFEPGSSEDAALRTLDPLLRTAVFPESSVGPATRILLELEKMHRVNTKGLA